MKSKTLKQILATTILISTLLITNAGISNAALQANPNTQYNKKDTPAKWIKNFRKIEEAGNGMGLSETLNTDLTPSSESNNIDIHMAKATEYGAMAILSASGYGNSSNDKAITTTTGNETGIILNTANWEWVAAGLKGSVFSGINTRYFDTYTSSSASAKIGDALGNASTANPGCAGWHSASNSYWVVSGAPYLRRGGGGIFSFYRYYDDEAFYSRGVVVLGKGL